MSNRIRSFFESIVFAGMKPSGRASGAEPAANTGWFGRLFAEKDPSDPLYLTNQTFGQRARRVLLTAVPVVLVLLVALVVLHFYGPKMVEGPKQLTAREIASKMTPAFNQEIKLDSNKDIQVVEVQFDHAGSPMMVGKLKNMTNRALVEAVVVFDLADQNFSQLGGVTVTETNLAAGATRQFKLPIEQANAVYAVVREVRTH